VLLLLAEGLRAEDVVEVLRACGRSHDAWCPALLELDPQGVRALPLTPSHDYALEDVARFCRTGEGDLLFRLDDVLDRARAMGHDINNPLGAALVEVQMLLMDASDEETQRSLGNLQDQLRLIKKMVAGLGFPGVRRRKPTAARHTESG
jgi:signal transduction histidine kinase